MNITLRPTASDRVASLLSQAQVRERRVLKAKPLISIVDDDESMRDAIKGLRRSLGYRVEAVASAQEFLSSRHVRRTSCLIADMQMPGMTGLGLHRHLSASGEPIPTILITAYPDNGVRERALSAGVIGYLSKPFEEDDLLACIRSALIHDRSGGR